MVMLGVVVVLLVVVVVYDSQYSIIGNMLRGRTSSEDLTKWGILLEMLVSEYRLQPHVDVHVGEIHYIMLE